MLRGYKVAVALLSRKWTARPRYGLPVTEYHDRGVQAGFLSKALTVSTIATIKAVKITPETLLLKRAARRATADTVPVDKAVIAFISCNGHTVGYKSFFPKKTGLRKSVHLQLCPPSFKVLQWVREVRQAEF